MTSAGEVQTITWGGVITGDVIVAPTGDEWRVTEWDRTSGNVTCEHVVTGETMTRAPILAKAVNIRPRPQAPAGECVSALLAAFPEATMDANLSDIASTCCEACGGMVGNWPLHLGWHEDLAARHHDTIAALLKDVRTP